MNKGGQGFRKDFLPHLTPNNPPQPLPVVTGSKHSDHVPLPSAKARQLLLKFSGMTKDGKKVLNPQPLTLTEFREMCRLIYRTFPVLAMYIEELVQDSDRRLSPAHCQWFFNELSRNGPACGMFQLGRNPELIEAIRQVVSGEINIFDSLYHLQLTMLQQHAPLIVRILHMAKQDESGRPRVRIRQVLHYLFELCLVPYSTELPQKNSYPPS